VINLYAAKETDRPRIVHESRNAILPRYERTQNTNLSKREKQVEELILRGMQRKPMAIALQISEHTVKLHISKILKKRKARGMVELAIRDALRKSSLSE
jgi:DNA-binding NarL/FixJ family response regulator